LAISIEMLGVFGWTGSSVTWGSTAKLSAVSPTEPLKLTLSSSGGGTTDDGVVPFVYTLLVPAETFPVMIGELDKVVPASSHRFKQTTKGEWLLSGAAAETVVISFAEDIHTLKTVSCVLSAAGTGALDCVGGAAGAGGCKCV
jgi:hypothetical protein